MNIVWTKNAIVFFIVKIIISIRYFELGTNSKYIENLKLLNSLFWFFKS